MKKEIEDSLENVSSIIVHKIPEDRQKTVKQKAADFVDSFFTKDLDQFNCEQGFQKLARIGNREATRVGDSTSSIAKKTSNNEDEEAYVQLQKIINALNRLSEKLEPSKTQFQNNWLGFGKDKKIAEYFKRFHGSEQEINTIIKSLLKSRDSAIKSGVFLKSEQRRIQESMNMYRDYLSFIDEVELLAQERFEDPYFHTKYPLVSKELLMKRLNETILRKQQQLLSNLNIAAQSYLAFGVLIENSNNLFSSIETTRHVTVTALQTAVALAKSIVNEQLTIEGLEQVNESGTKGVKNISDGMSEYERSKIGAMEAQGKLEAEFHKLRQQTQKLDKASKERQVS